MQNPSTKVAVITGAGSGIGRSIALHLAELGYHSAVLDIKRERAEETVALISDAGGKSSAHYGDVTSKADVARQLGEVRTINDNIAVLVNNAGYCQIKSLLDISDLEMMRMLEVHVLGTLLFTQGVVPIMQRNKFGRIINIVSARGIGASEFTAHYQAAKAAQHSLSKSSAIAFKADGITVNSVSPSTVDTNLFHENDENFKKYLGHGTVEELRRREIANKAALVLPIEVARIVAFLAQADSQNITGEVIGI